jgi:hypothetical protein
VNDIALTPEEIAEWQKWQKPIKGADGFTRFDERTRPHYWIYKWGVTVWNKWGVGELEDAITKIITTDIKKYFGENEGLPLPNEEIDFSNLIFWRRDFIGAVFVAKVDFRYALFERDTDFRITTFQNSADFSSAKFTHDVDFAESIFEKEVKFDFTSFEQEAIFWRVSFSNYASFIYARFKENAIFWSANFNQQTDFLNVIFESQAPAFEGAIFAKHVNFSVSEGNFPEYDATLKNNTQSGFQHNAEIIATRYSVLKSAMKKMEFADKELFFHGKELEAKSYDENEPKHLRWLYKRYGEFSDYGQSITQPLYWLFFLTIIFFFLYVLHACYFNENKEKQNTHLLESAYSAAHFSIPFLPKDDELHNLSFGIDDICGVKMKKGQVVKKNMWCIASFNFIKFFHDIFALLFVLLTALGLRNNLRMR